MKLRSRISSRHPHAMRLLSGDAALVLSMVFLLLLPIPLDLFKAFGQTSRQAQRSRIRSQQAADSTAADSTVFLNADLIVKTPASTADSTDYAADSIPPTVVTADDLPYGLSGKKIFNPDPTRAVWMSALFPGLGQIYNRRYWKLPIIVAGFMGLGYGTSWNNGQFQDYSQAYRDIVDSDPGTNSYMNFFPPTTDEGSLDKTWLTATMKSRKDYYRRNRDLCIICMVALYLLCMVDAYVDAQMAHFDISPDLSLDISPTMMSTPGQARPNFGLNWAFTF
ncbi:MAG: DUF5683 domain-containing protein [Muribaculum sp.]|nr:DUF5683 domain-containing protein [Muribaculum sp.]